MKGLAQSLKPVSGVISLPNLTSTARDQLLHLFPMTKAHLWAAPRALYPRRPVCLCLVTWDALGLHTSTEEQWELSGRPLPGSSVQRPHSSTPDLLYRGDYEPLVNIL